MCGICGVVSSKIKINKAIIQKMNNCLIHRGPDDSSYYFYNNDNSPSVGLGHRRLSILDLSQSGRQPMSNENNKIWLIFNGEIYNYKKLRKSLQAKGHTFKSRTDSEVIIHLYEEYGENCLQWLSGMFAFAIWDEIKKRIFIARDRVGKKPLQYYYKNKELIFASEFQSLLASGRIEKSINLEAVDDYLSLGYIPAPHTIYNDIYKLPPAHYLIYEEGKLTIKKYWTLDYSQKTTDSFNDACEKVMELLVNAVKMRMESDVPLGAFLSGGIDSSVILCLMAKLSSKPIKTFSIGFDENQYNELKYAKTVADCFSADHHEFLVKPNAMEILPLLVERYGEPYADSSAIPTYYLSKLTKQHVTVALNGDGGDELFAGYERYNAMHIAEYYCKVPETIRKKIFRPLYQKIPDSIDPKNKFRRLRRFLEGSEKQEAERYLKWTSLINSDLSTKLYSPDMKKRLEGKSTINWFKPYFENIGKLKLLDKLLLVDTNFYLPYDLLVKVDIASMTNSLEARSPFLDHKLMEYVAALPTNFKLKGFKSKYILKKNFEKNLPKKIICRPKMGFGVPIRLWLKNDLKDFVRDTLLAPVSLKRGYFNSPVVNKMVNNHIAGTEDNSGQLWSLMMFELWHRRFIDNQV